jgi:hypothetical protein
VCGELWGDLNPLLSCRAPLDLDVGRRGCKGRLQIARLHCALYVCCMYSSPANRAGSLVTMPAWCPSCLHESSLLLSGCLTLLHVCCNHQPPATKMLCVSAFNATNPHMLLYEGQPSYGRVIPLPLVAFMPLLPTKPPLTMPPCMSAS